MTSDVRPQPELDDAAAWTSQELAAIRAALIAHRTLLQSELELADSDMVDVAAASADGRDEGDIAGFHAELTQESVQAANTFAILVQLERVVSRLDEGLYGRCETCGGPVGRARLEAFPRATQCRDCAGRAA